jgi:hypothetical protein
MPEIEPLKGNMKPEQQPPKPTTDDKAMEELAKRAQKSTRYERHKVKEQRENAEKVFESLKKGEVPKLDLKAMSSADIAAAKAIIADIEHAHELSWLTKDGIPDNPIVLDVVARISSAPQELQDDPKWLIAQGLELQEAQKGSMPDELKIAIQKVNYRIRNRVIELTGINEEDRHAIFLSSFDPENLTSVTPEQAEVVEMAEYYLSEAGSPARGGARASAPGAWLLFENQPTTLPQNPTLQAIISELRKMEMSPDWRAVQEKYRELRILRESPGVLAGDDVHWAEGISMRLLETYRAMTGNHINFTPEEVFDLTRGPDAARVRDRVFHQRIKKVLFDPNEETQRQLNLYDQADIDTFMEVISNSEARHPVTKKMINIGKEVVGHYRNKLDTVLRLSDLELQARHSAGDVESFSKTLNFFENKFAIEATQDPIVEDMLQCYEMAIKINRDNNEDFMPSELTRYNPRTHTTPIDELTLQLFRERMAAGAVRDYVRDPVSGLPKLDPATGGTTLLRSNRPFKQDKLDNDELELKLFATLRIAKGLGVLTNRTIELYAFTRTPLVDIKQHDYTQPFEQSIAVFSSKPFGGLTRWVNPMSEWMRMFGFGDTLFVPFFNTLVNGKEGAAKQALRWTMDQCVDAVNMAESGDRKKLREKFGEGVSRITDLIEGTSFHSRFGPSSMWGILDSTQGWKAKDLERLGGSMRLVLAKSWAESALESVFNSDPRHKNLEGVALKNARMTAFIGEGPKVKEWKERVDKKERIYKTWIWAQTVMRNPQGVASHVRVEYGVPNDRLDAAGHPVVDKDGRPVPYKGKLRSKIMYEIFDDNDLASYTLKNEHGEPKRLIIERDVASGHKLTVAQKDLAARIAIVDADLGAVMRYAMNNGPEPRNITNADFDIIKGKRVLFVNGRRVVVSETRRREQAKEYFNKVQQKLLGKAVGEVGAAWDFDTWRNNLGVDADPVLQTKKPEEVKFIHEDTIDTVLNQAEKAALPHHNIYLTKELVDEPVNVHIGTEDTQWSYLDLDSLGDRHWGRKGNDNLNHAKMEMLLMKHFHTMTGKPKMEDLVKSIQEIGMQGKDEDPKEAAKFASLWAEGTHNVYRQRKLAGIPVIGRVLPALGIPMSLAQERLGVHSATHWSMNNSVQFADMIGATRVIPNKQIIDGKDFGPYTMQRLRKELGASRWLAAAEMFFIGYVIAMIMVSISAASKGMEEDK